MIPLQTFENYPVFGNNATKVQPDNSKYSNGFQEGDVYPAEYVNWAWAKNSKGVTELNTGLTSVEKELNTILTCAGFTPSSCADCVDQVYKSMMCKIEACVGTSAPKAHASSATTYGVGNADCYGHLKISDTYTSVLSACTGVAASQMAVACVYSVANGKAAVGNTAGAALAATASAGTATTAARSDHVHAIPKCVHTSSDTSAWFVFSRYNTCSDSNYLLDVSNCCEGTNRYGIRVACATAATAATCAASSCYVDRGVSSNNYNWHLLFGYSNAAATCSGVYASCGCPLTFNPSTGVLTAKCFCGTASNSNCAGCVLYETMCENSDRYVMFGNSGATLGGYNTIGGSGKCPFTFNPATGVLKTCCFCGRASGADAASRLYTNTIVFKSCYVSRTGTSPNFVKCYNIYACVCRNDTGCGVYLLAPASVSCQGLISVNNYDCLNALPRTAHLSTSCYTLVGTTSFSTSCSANCNCITEADQLMLAIDYSTQPS